MQLSDIKKKFIELKKNNLNYLLKHEKIEINGEYSKIHSHFYDFITPNKINETDIDYFDIFDSFLDYKYENLKGENFNKKLEKLPNSTRSEQIIKNSYRIAIIIRNAQQHHIPINKDSKFLTIDNIERNCYLKISIQSAFLLKSLLLNYCYLLIYGYPLRYCEEILSKIYNDLITGVETLKYNNKFFFYENFPSKLLNSSRRLLLCNCDYSIDDKKLKINISDTFINNKDYPLDLYIKFNNSIFIYPIELLKKDKKIEKDELENFVFNGDSL